MCRPLLFVLVVAICVVFAEKTASDVKSAIVMYRHGDRTPVDPYPKDPWGDPKYWPVAWGELTDLGKLQHYHLGGQLRQRYQHLLKTKYDVSQVYVRTTDKDRAIESALANLAGMYPTSDDNEFVSGLPWQPVPIHSVPEELDAVLAMKAPCPKFDIERKALLETAYFKKLDKDFQPLYRYVSKHTGRSINDIVNLGYIYDILLIEELYNFTLPEWTKSIYPDKLLPVAKISFMIDTYTPTLARLKVGPLLNEITNYLVDASEGKKHPNIWIYSAHDTTLASVLNGLGLKSYELPGYASNIIFELIPGKDLNSSSVRVLYNMEELTIPRCGNTCPIYQWVTNYAHLLTKNHTADCYVKPQIIEIQHDIFNNDNTILYLLSCIIVLLILVIFFITIMMKKSLSTVNPT